MQPSARAIALIEHFEIGDAYDPRVSWPGGESGLTIGVGYDLGYSSPAQIAEDWAALPSGVVIRLQSYAGRTGKAAQTLLYATRDMVIPEPIGRAVFERIDIPRWSQRTADAFDCAGLSPDSFGALVSLCFNRGTAMADTTPTDNRLEMRRIRDALAAGNPHDVPDLIRSMKRLWIGKGLDGLLARRDAEAALFQAGLIVAPSFVPPAPTIPAPVAPAVPTERPEHATN